MRGIQYAGAYRINHSRLWNTGSPAFAGDDEWKHTFSFPRHELPEFCNLVVPLFRRGRRESRAPAAPVASCAKESTRVRNYRFSQDIPAFPAQWCYGLFRALPGERPLLPPSPAWDLPRGLTPGSRRQDHTTSPSAAALSSGTNAPERAASIAFRTYVP